MDTERLACQAIPLPAMRAGALVAGRYAVVRLLSSSARSCVYLVDDQCDHLLRTMKRPGCRGGLDCPCGRSYDLAYELSALRRLRARRGRVPRPVDQFWLAGGLCIVTSYVRGVSLDRLIDAGRVTPELAVEVAVQLCATLAGAHRLGIVHHDVKPSNVIVGRDGRATLIDWDAAMNMRPAGERALRRSFTPGYASLEQLAGEALPSNDVYGLGRLLDEALPRRGPLLAAIVQRATAALPIRYADTVMLGRDLLRLQHMERFVSRLKLTLY